ncbi:MAG: Undecaprenyl-diphosphatase [candidate division CPR1 bacterium GW2011_GWC1_49_13]|uniref:Undecaprenyl-diphosphatase n=1 Tax=candidate division CPR1 bacterium GW2011_GWC1_49_13 TaxID=1618342 RepID=A0A0G1YIE2_9BACT|nr:MAG: Undecaprenyl-diphosphatase [candidate division CPR1 bacterium GW2011_GWC1_49_13]
MPFYQALILGIIQGITEIFPISSSGHLIIFPALLGWEPHSLSFDAALHLGTGLALLFFFAGSWLKLLKERNWKMLFFLLLASVPAGLVGLFGGDWIEENLRDPKLTAYALIGVAFLMLLGEGIYRNVNNPKEEAGIWDVLAIGFAQTLALFPGVSRSGITILTGMGRGIRRERSAHFSFLISLPIVFAAGLYQLLGVYQAGELAVQAPDFAVGILSSFLVGLLAIKFLFSILRKYSLVPFAIYRIALGVFLLLFLGR